ncbi:MAG: discoidin domain-containing protein [Sedimentisphaerales bacterium]|nr:discoidin domain-containing protein [Sedimentisphaerales bacterium]
MKREFIKKSITVISCIIILLYTGCSTNKIANRAKDKNNQRVITLAGKWFFRLDPANVGEKENWHRNNLPDTIELPGSTIENGYGDDISLDTSWTGSIIDTSFFTDAKYEKYRQPGSIKIPFWLTPVKHYKGPAWYQKQIDIPSAWAGKRITLFLERCHWETKVWANGIAAGIQDSLCTPQIHDLSKLIEPGKNTITIRVDNSIKYQLGNNAHSVSDHTQTNWNGIIGKIELQAADPVWISNVQVYPDINNKSAKVVATITNSGNKNLNGTLNIRAKSFNTSKSHTVPQKSVEFNASGPEITVEMNYTMGNETQLWDEFSPALYKLTVSLAAKAAKDTFHNEKTVTFGMRQIATKATQFTINNRPTFLRGTLECCIFPLTGYPHMDIDGWLRILRIAKAHGLNHLRFHSWCPPQAAFQAADLMGFIYHVECPAWATIGDGKPIDKFIYAEGDRILNAYGNHPSFCMLAYGNEPGGRNQKRFLGDLVNYWKQKDPRRLYTSGAGWPVIPENQFHSTPAPRGHQWGAGLSSRFNAKPPETSGDYRSEVEKYNVPIVSHEIGQWCVFPNLNEIKKYTGVLKARNFEIVRDSLNEKKMLDQAQDFLMASGKLQALLYKQEIESALRTPCFGGFQLLDLHDFPGQGTALVGILDPFWDSKGYIEPREHNRYCNQTVPLLRMKKRIWTTGETFRAIAEIAHFGPAPIENAVPLFSIYDSDLRKIASGQLPQTTIPIGNGITLGDISVPLDNIDAPKKLIVIVSIKDTSFENHWDIWVYPAQSDTTAPSNILIADSFDEEVRTKLKTGGKVLLMPHLNSINSDIPAGFTSIFWNTQWTRQQPPYTLGILCDPKHPALAKFPTEFHSNWQWWDLVIKSKFMILDEFDPELRPIVQVIDDWNTNRRLGLIFETTIGTGKLLVCSIDLRNNLDERPVARQMLGSLLSYMDSTAFSPKLSIDTEHIQSLFKIPTLLSRARITMADSYAPGHEAQNAIDQNPNTIWHTSWQPTPKPYPHEIQIELPEQTEIKGLKYTPRQDMSNGWISEYEVYVSTDGKNWGKPCAAGTFQKGRSDKNIFLKVAAGKFVRFVALAGFDNQPFAAIAELDIITAEQK